MTGQPTADEPERGRTLARIVAVGLVGLVTLLVFLIAGGVFDPKPLGPLLQTDHPGAVTLPGAGETMIPQQPPWPSNAPPDRFSVRLRAAYVSGELDSGYGPALSDGANRLLVAVSPLGYVAVREENGGDPVYHVPWQTWPHVREGEEENEIWLDVENGDDRAAITAWINREVLWQGQVEWQPDTADLWLGSFGGPATIDFRALEWFAAPGN